VEGLNLASLSTPDALETLLTLAFILISITGPWKGWRALCLPLTAALMVATRTDAVVLVAALMLLEWLSAPRHRLVTGLISLVALSTYLTIEVASGNAGYVALLNFVADHSQLVVPDRVFNLHRYVALIASAIYLTLGADYQYPLFILAVCLLAITWYREGRLHGTPQADRFNQQALILSAALALYLVVRFALFPLPITRYVTNAYVMAGILFARAIQPMLRLPQPKKGTSATSAASRP
jgi:hypothetical protein